MAKVIWSFRDLDAWHAAMDLAICAYRLAGQLPTSERFELSAQIRRSAVSVPSNVSEGHCCGKDGGCLSHLRIALGSLGELETRIEIARRLGFVAAAELREIEQLCVRTGMLINGLARSVRRHRRADGAML